MASEREPDTLVSGPARPRRHRGRGGPDRKRATTRRARPELEALERLVVMNASNLVVSAAVVPQNLVSGQSITVRWDVANRGADAANSSWSDSVYLSTDATLDSADVLLGSAVPAPTTLAAGTSYTQQKSFAVPAASSGNYYLIFQVNSDGAQAETSTGDNTRAVPVSLQGQGQGQDDKADLIVTDATAPAEAYIGQISISYTIKNQGAATANGYVQDLYYLSTTSTLDLGSADQVGSNFYSIGLAAGASKNVASTFDLPSWVEPGDYYLFVVTDGYNQISESNDNNNSSGPVPIAIKATDVDLEITDATAPSSAVLGDNVELTWTVVNNGTSPATAGDWSDNIYLSTRDTYDDSAILVANGYRWNSSPGLAAGESYTQDLTVSLPGTAAGNYYLVFVANAYDDQFETSDQNNTFALPIAVSLPDVDLHVTDATAPATFKMGDSITVGWTVANQGAQATNAEYWYDYIYLSTKNTYDSSAQFVTSYYHSNYDPLEPGDSYTSSYTGRVPNGGSVLAGDYYLLIVSNPVSNAGYGYQPETNTENNVYAVKVTIEVPDVDLQVTDATAPADVAAGSAASVNWTVTNAGSDKANAGAWYDYVYISKSDTYGGGVATYYLTSLGHMNNPPLDAGASYTQSVNVTIPSFLSSGDYYLLFYANQYSTQAETNTSNNVRAVQVHVGAGAADLKPTSSAAPANATAGQYVSVTWAVANQGTADAPTLWSDTAYLSANNNSDTSGDPALATISIGSQSPLKAGKGYVVSMDVFIPAATATGDYYLKFQANSNGGLNEGNVANNLTSRAIHIDGASATPVTVSAFQVNDGGAQRSMVTSLAVTFSGPVTFDAGAFSLKRSDGKTVTLDASSAVVGGKAVVTLTFSGDATESDSLADGRYTLTIDKSKIHGDAGQGLDADYVDHVFRLFGDVQGRGQVDNSDYFVFRSAAGKSAGQSGYLWYLDALGDGSVDVAGASSDYQKFLGNFRKVLA